MDYETITASAFGCSLRGFGLNILVRDVQAEAAFLNALFSMQVYRASSDFAILIYHEQILQLHSDAAYGAHPLLGLLPEKPPRGAGIELRLYDSDPDEVVARAGGAGGTILQHPIDKPHGLREAHILDLHGYVWVPSRPIDTTG